jgi:hypothetical protein
MLVDQSMHIKIQSDDVAKKNCRAGILALKQLWIFYKKLSKKYVMNQLL